MSLPVVFQQPLVSGFHICSPNILKKGGENLFLRKVGASHKKVCIEGTDQYFFQTDQYIQGMTNFIWNWLIFWRNCQYFLRIFFWNWPLFYLGRNPVHIIPFSPVHSTAIDLFYLSSGLLTQIYLFNFYLIWFSKYTWNGFVRFSNVAGQFVVGWW